MQNNNNYIDINECTSRGSCSVSPSIAALEYLSFLFLQNISYYLLELEKLGANNKKIKKEIINVIAILVSVNDFNEKELYSTIMNEFFILKEVEKTYKNLCKNNSTQPKLLKPLNGFSAQTTLPQTISIGEKLYTKNIKNNPLKIRNLTEILNIVLKSVSLNHVKLMDFDIFDETSYKEILKTLNIFNQGKTNIQDLINCISNLANTDKNLQLLIGEQIVEKFGKIDKVAVSHSTKKGKAILVSGNNFFDLLTILDITQDKEIDVYTHSNLLIVHSFEKFKKYKNLIGHYGTSSENCILDFATFPGAILITQDFHTYNEYFYRGRLFSNDYIVPKGVTKIENGNFFPVLDAAISSKGFSKGKVKENTNIGFNLDEVNKKFDEIIEKLNSNRIKKLYIIGIDPHSEIQKEYFNEIFANLKQDEFVISFSYEFDKKNVFTINVGNYTPFVTKILKIFFNKYPINSDKITFFFTNCDVMSISGVITIKNLDAKNIYMANCSPTVINPSVIKTFKDIYDIHLTDNPIYDLKKFRK